LDCRLYPIKIKFKQDKAVIGLSLGCKYISFLTEKKKKELCYRVVIFLKKAPSIISNDYLNLMQSINFISKPKNFWMRKIVEMIKKKSFWEIVK